MQVMMSPMAAIQRRIRKTVSYDCGNHQKTKQTNNKKMKLVGG
jgi:hypothetical protein